MCRLEMGLRRLCQCEARRRLATVTAAASANVYNAAEIEARCRRHWETPEFVAAMANAGTSRDPFVMCLPPPNITGNLHLGHALTVSIQDVLCRWNRMNGRRVCWIPGFDHAGIATQMVVAKRLLQQRGSKTLEDIGREAFVRECYRWKEERVAEISEQLKRLGSSLDWSRSYFTLDPKFSRAVAEAFLRLQRDGTIFRDLRLVNYSPFMHSTVSQMEVEHRKIDEPTELHLPSGETVSVGYLYFFAYPLADEDRTISVATTRPETMLADCALAVHPSDDRYAALVGRFVRHPLTGDRLPIVADESVDQKQGTGVVKITPAHSFADYELARRHKLPVDRSCFDDDGCVHLKNVKWSEDIEEEASATFEGLSRFDARERIVQLLEQLSLFDRREQAPTTIPLCARSGDILEPMLKAQWFLNCRALAEDAERAVVEGRLRIEPEHWSKVWTNWHRQTADGAGDWCLSRQLWWGHRVPAFELAIDDAPDQQLWISARSSEEAHEIADELIALVLSDRKVRELRESGAGEYYVNVTLRRDEDVLDTWFSSALVPLVVAGWPARMLDVKKHGLDKKKVDPPFVSPLFPLTLMETGSDILGFWVSRMVMLTAKLLSSDGRPTQLPFNSVLLHGMVRDAQGRKMSKTLGNVVDPIDVIDGRSLEAMSNRIRRSEQLTRDEKAFALEGVRRMFPEGILQCGADALRFALLSYDVQGQSIKVDIAQMHHYRSFCNKLWQAFKYATGVWAKTPARPIVDRSHLDTADRWILSRVARVLVTVVHSLEKNAFHEATRALHDFVWFELCDVYLEHTKTAVWSKEAERIAAISDVLFVVFDELLRALAPFMPHLAEDLYARLALKEGDNHGVHLTSYPSENELKDFLDETVERQMTDVLAVVDCVRSLKRDFDMKQSANVRVRIRSTDLERAECYRKALAAVTPLLRRLCAATLASDDAPVSSAFGVVNGAEVLVEFEEPIDCKEVIGRLEKRMAVLEKRKASLVRKRQLAGDAALRPARGRRAVVGKPVGKVEDEVADERAAREAHFGEEIAEAERELERLATLLSYVRASQRQ